MAVRLVPAPVPGKDAVLPAGWRPLSCDVPGMMAITDAPDPSDT